MRVSCTLAVLLAACSSELPPQGQVVIHLDTDAPLVDPPLFDRVLVEIAAPGETTPCEGCSRELPIDVAKIHDRTFSFGFAARPRVTGYTARLRLFRSAGRGTPRPTSTIELLGYLPAVGEDGITTITATFHTDDVGKPRGTYAAPIIFDDGAPTASAEGTWSSAKTIACNGAHAGAQCVPGGPFFMGDPRVTVNDPNLGGAKEHLVVLAPFFLDAHEVTVADLRASGLAKVDSRGKAVDPVDDSKDETAGQCDWTTTAGPWEDLPVDCTSWALARSYCQSKGGDLPTEAQFERVAAAWGTLLTPWGDRDPTCDEGGVFLSSDKSGGGCGSFDPFAIGHRVLPNPPGRGALDRQGSVVDLAANLAEWVLDDFQNDDGACWTDALLIDPKCNGDATARAIRGGDLASRPVDFAQTRRRREAVGYPEIGFRCAYPAK